MKTLKFLIISLFLSFTSLFSQQISNEIIEKACGNFINQYQQNIVEKSLRKVSLMTTDIISLKEPTSSNTVAYVTNLSPKGFVILSSNQSIEPVIAYSFNSNFSMDTTQQNILYHMVIKDMTLRKEALPLIDEKVKAKNQDKWDRLASGESNYFSATDFQQWPSEGTTATGGWVETTWTQSSPYNDFCPLDPQTGFRSVVGCVATAIAQVINYHKYIGNISLNSSDEYISHGNHGDINIDADSTILNFPSFEVLNRHLDTLRIKYTNGFNLSNEDLAALNFVVGISVNMMYNSNESGASETQIIPAITGNFGYYSAERILNTYPDYYYTLKSNMVNALPALMMIHDTWDSFTTHEIIVDGYNTEEYFHLNFGWGPNSPDPIIDAWYHIPSEVSGGFNSFTIFGPATVNIMPFHENYVDLNVKRQLNFGGAYIGNASSAKELQIQNIGNQNILIESITATEPFEIGYSADNFADSLNSSVIQQDQTTTLFVRFKPDSIKFYQGYIFINVASNGGTDDHILIECKGCGVPAGATIINDSLVSGTWTKVNSPYYVCTNISVAQANSLTLEPGVQAFFYPFSFTIGEDASLKAIGAIGDSIIFTAVDSSSGWPGMIFENSDSDDTLSYCIITNCDGTDYLKTTVNLLSGAITCYRSNPIITHCSIRDNKGEDGGGICLYGSSPLLEENVICYNEAKRGGGIYWYSSRLDANVLQNRICNNIASEDGGGIYLSSDGGHVLLKNNVIVNNSTTTWNGAGIYCYWAYPKIINNTICNNKAANVAGGIFYYGGLPSNNSEISNTIFWGNEPSQIHLQDDVSDPDILYNDIQGGLDSIVVRGTFEGIFKGNLDIDPLLINPSSGKGAQYSGLNGDWHLQNNSPCIDAGNPEVSVGEEPFPNGYTVNIGAYGGTQQAQITTGPFLWVSSHQIDFGLIPAGDTVKTVLILKNGGGSVLTISDLMIGDETHFSIENYQNNITLQSGEKDSIDILFHPDEGVEGDYNSQLTISINEINDKSISLVGRGYLGTIVDTSSVSGSWQQSGSPYYIMNDIQLDENDSLTIEPGVLVLFQGPYRLLVNGQLLAKGTKTDSIKFTASNENEGWGGIGIDQLSKWYINDLDTVLIAFCVIENVKHVVENTYCGWGISLSCSALNLKNSLIHHCRKGGIIGGYASTVLIDSSTFIYNDGRGVEGNISITNSVIANNSGGGVSAAFVKNCIIANNSKYGGVISGGLIENCTIVNNSFEFSMFGSGGGGVFTSGTLKNSIVWGNQAVNGPQVKVGEGAEIIYCAIEGGQDDIYNKQPNWLDYNYVYENNIETDPQFVAPSAGVGADFDGLNADWHIQSGSPGVDSGDPNTSVGNELFPHGYRINLGAYGGTIAAQTSTGLSLCVTPVPVEFGLLHAGDQSEKYVYLKNGCEVDIEITGISFFIGSNYAASKTNFFLASGSIDSMIITFSPTEGSSGFYEDSLIVTSIQLQDISIPITGYGYMGTIINTSSISGIWTLSDNPYFIMNDVSVVENGSLSVEPGVKILFTGHYSLNIGENAKLSAIGNSENYVEFTALDTTRGWEGIYFDHSSDDDILQYVKIFYAKSIGNRDIRAEGGGIDCRYSSPVIRESIISHNSAKVGGGISCLESAAIIINNVVSYNLGAGIYLENPHSDILFDNNLIYGNIGSSAGGIQLMNGGGFEYFNPKLINNVITKNSGRVTGGIWGHGMSPFIENTILWGNSGLSYDEIFFAQDNPEFSHCLIKVGILPDGSVDMGGNILNVDPLFVNPDGEDFHLQPGSPCIDAGNPDPLYNDPEDPNNPGFALWPAMGTIRNDMGAYGGGGVCKIDYDFPQQAWYMISLPVIPQDSSVSTLFPTALNGTAYHWNSSTQSYDAVTKIEPKKGYWLAIPQATTCSCSGIPLNSFTEQFPATGWYMIGSVIGQSDFSNPDDNPNGMVLTPAFTWNVNNGCYISANTLNEKNGFWVAVLGACDLTVNNSAGTSSQPKFTQKKFIEFSKMHGETPPSPPTIDWQTGEILQIPEKFVLRQNYPNPFNPVTNIKFDLPENSLVEIFIYNILGQKVKTLVNNYLQAGNHTIVWNGMNDYDQQLSTGIYLCFIKAGEFKAINKLLLLK